MGKIIIGNIQLGVSLVPDANVRVNFKAMSPFGVMVETYCEVPYASTPASVKSTIITAARAALTAAGDTQASVRESIIAGAV